MDCLSDYHFFVDSHTPQVELILPWMTFWYVCVHAFLCVCLLMVNGDVALLCARSTVSYCVHACKLAHDPHDEQKTNKQHISKGIQPCPSKLETSTMSRRLEDACQCTGSCDWSQWVEQREFMKSENWSHSHRAHSRSLHWPKRRLLMHMYENRQLIKQTHNIHAGLFSQLDMIS